MFVSDGAVWKHARILVMPIFARHMLQIFQASRCILNRMLELVPRNGETVDLRPLFRRLVSYVLFLGFGFSLGPWLLRLQP